MQHSFPNFITGITGYKVHMLIQDFAPITRYTRSLNHECEGIPGGEVHRMISRWSHGSRLPHRNYPVDQSRIYNPGFAVLSRWSLYGMYNVVSTEPTAGSLLPS